MNEEAHISPSGSPDAWSKPGDTPPVIKLDLATATLSQPRLVPSSIPEPTRLSSLRALELLIASEGNLALAAELAGLNKTTGPALLLAAIVGDENNHDTMARYVRAFTTMKLFSMMSELQEAVSNAVTEEKLKPADLVRAFSNVIESINAMTDSKTTNQNINVFDHVIKSMPPDVREALRIVASNGETVGDGKAG